MSVGPRGSRRPTAPARPPIWEEKHKDVTPPPPEPAKEVPAASAAEEGAEDAEAVTVIVTGEDQP
jgi:hypothetical protein